MLAQNNELRFESKAQKDLRPVLRLCNICDGFSAM